MKFGQFMSYYKKKKKQKQKTDKNCNLKTQPLSENESKTIKIC